MSVIVSTTGLELVVSNDFGDMCIFCCQHGSARPVVVVADDKTSPVGVCEPCAGLLGWAWRQFNDEDANPPFPTEPSACLVLISRPRYLPRVIGADDNPDEVPEVPDPVAPREILMVRRKDTGDFALPGGKVEKGETPAEAAVRELLEETGVVTWPGALEVLYEGFSARGRLVRVYLCRGYAGSGETRELGIDVEWKPRGPMEHSGCYRGFYRGVEICLNARFTLGAATEQTTGISQPMGPAAAEYLRRWTDRSKSPSAAEPQILAGLKVAMSVEEKDMVELVVAGNLVPKA